MAKSALNRHHWFRLRKTRARYYGDASYYIRTPEDYIPDRDWRRKAKRINQKARTPAICSCSCCANNRHKLGHKAMHDIRWDHKTGFELRHKHSPTLDQFYNDEL